MDSNKTHRQGSTDVAYHQTPEKAIIAVIFRHPAFEFTDIIRYISDRPDFMGATARVVHLHDFEGNNDTDISTEVIRHNHQGEWCQVSIKDILIRLNYSNDDGPARVRFTTSLIVPEGRLESYEYLPREAHMWRGERKSTSPIDRPSNDP